MARLEIDIASKDEGVDQLVKTLDTLANKLDVADKKAVLFGNSMKLQEGVLKTYNSTLDKLLSQGLPTYNQYVQKVRSEIARMTVALDHQKEVLSEQRVLDNLSIKLSQIANNQRLMSNETQRLNAEIRANQSAIDGLIKLGVDPADKRIQSLQNTVSSLRGSLAALSATNPYSAFQKTGQIIPDLERKLQNLRNALNRATDTRSIALYNVRIRETQNELDKLRNLGLRAGNALRQVGKPAPIPANIVPPAAIGGFKGVIGLASRLAPALLSVAAAQRAVTESFSTALKIDALQTSFGFIAEDSADRLAALRVEADRLGVSFLTLAETNKQFIAAASASNFDLEQADKIFASVANAGAKLKLSNDQLRGTFLALEQMISKGTVSMEELRRQLGDRLPGAFAMAARSMGMTEKEFNKLVSTGQVLSKDLLPKLAEEMDKTYGRSSYDKISSLQAEVNRLGNTFTEFVEKTDLANNIFLPFVQALNTGVRAIANLNDETEEAVRNFKKSEEAYIRNNAELTKLVDRYSELQRSSKLSATEQEELRNIIRTISEIVPGAVTEWSAYGDAIDINTIKVRELLAAHRNLLATLNKDALAKLSANVAGTEKGLEGAVAQMELLNRTGQEYITVAGKAFGDTGYTIFRGDVQANIDKFRTSLRNLYVEIQDLGGELNAQQRNFLAGFGLDAAGEAMRAHSRMLKQQNEETAEGVAILGQLRKRQKELNEARDSATSLDEIKKINFELKAVDKQISDLTGSSRSATKAADELARALEEAARTSTLASLDGQEKEIQQIEDKYARWEKLAKGNKDALKKLEEFKAKEIAAVNNKYYQEELKEGEAFLKKRQEQLAKFGRQNVDQIRKNAIDEADTTLVLQRRLFESRAQTMIRALNRETEAQNKALDEQRQQDIKAGKDSVEANRRYLEAKTKLQEDYFKRIEELTADQRSLDIITSFDGTASSMALASVRDQMDQLKLSFEAGAIGADDFLKKISDLSVQQEQLGLLQTSLNGVSDAVGNLFGDALFEPEKALENLGEAFKNLAKNAISELAKIAIRQAINAALAKTTLATTTAASMAAAQTTAAAWAPAAALVSAATFGANAAAGGVALASLMASTKALSMLGAVGFARGGYTGNKGIHEIAGVVHGKEYVINAKATRENLPLLRAINNGMDVSRMLRGSGIGSSPSVTPIAGSPVGVDLRVQVAGNIRNNEIRLSQLKAERNDKKFGRGL